MIGGIFALAILALIIGHYSIWQRREHRRQQSFLKLKRS